MSATGLAIELPTNRQSRHYDLPAFDVHDPNYIPVLNERAEIKVDFSQPSFSALPSLPKPHESPAQVYLKRSKSGSAPETVVRGQTDSIASRRANACSKNTEPQELGRGYAPVLVNRNLHGSEDDTASNSEHSSTTASAHLEANVFMIPGNAAPKEIHCPAVPHSARSSISSVNKRSNLPTSRFNQKTPSLPSIRATTRGNASPSPFTSQVSTPELPTPPSQHTLPRSLSEIPIPPDPSPVSPQSTLRLQAMKSTASERRARALNSHPYSLSITSKPSSFVDEADETPLMKQLSVPESRPPSIRSRSHSICSSHPATPAPTTPLPDLPPSAKRPPTRERPMEKISTPVIQQTPPSPLPPTVPGESHVEMAEFIKTQRTTVFRRFDDVHVRLLLHLQDEIGILEKRLLEEENLSAQTSGSLSQRPPIMLELRKVLAEYDHLFANWSAMQANKASEDMRDQLATWLQNPNGGAKAISNGARADLEWLKTSRDLSAVSIDPEKRIQKSASATTMQSSLVGRVEKGTNPGAGGFWSLFGCASKRR